MRIEYGTVVVGAGLGGLRTVENLRRLGYSKAIALVGSESHLPYDRPPLTKQVLRGELDSTQLRPDLDGLGVEPFISTAAVALDPAARVVHLHDGQELAYGSVVLATGARPRLLSATPGARNLHVVRTIDDALALRTAAASQGSFAVIGGGFIGCEVAASLRCMGADVDLIELGSCPLGRALGEVGGRIVTDLLVSHGVTVHAGIGVERIETVDRLATVVLADGATVSASDVVIGLGVTPDVGWLASSGLAVDDGIVCDAAGRASLPGVYAVGDAARWYQPALGAHRRIEHWMSAIDQSVVVASGIASHTPMALSPVPYFWSEQFDVNIQALGFVDPGDDVSELSVNGRTILLYSRDDIVKAAVGFSAGKHLMRLRGPIARGSSLAEACSRLAL